MVITASEARSQLFPLIERVNTDSTPIFITSKKGNAVLVSESEWEAMIETMYLLRTSANREHLAKSRTEVLSGDLFEYELPITSASQGKKISRPQKKISSVKKAPKSRKKVVTTLTVRSSKKNTPA